MRQVFEPSLSLLSRWAGMPGNRMRSPSPLPTITPTRLSALQRLFWLFASR
ncbi:MAG TPA: hypothetical protein VF169_08265 [Albitalea sp.]|uniref:hypothetical protein n=1 Tax=Piscinibacter sp. TaxID=1903157 RepID=UPI002ED13DD1